MVTRLDRIHWTRQQDNEQGKREKKKKKTRGGHPQGQSKNQPISNILKILPPKNEIFQVKNSDIFFLILLKT